MARSRAYRRFRKEVMKDKARRIVKDVWAYKGESREKVTQYFVRNCDNLKACDGECCANPRKRDGVTNAESQSELSFREELRDVG